MLPVYLALTRTLLIVAGPTYHRRLWCIIEVFTFLRMGADLSRVQVEPMLAAACAADPEGGSAASTAAAELARIRTCFEGLRVQEAECYSSDRAILWAAIETGFASLDAFNQLCSVSMLRAIDERGGATPGATVLGGAAAVYMYPAAEPEGSKKAKKPPASPFPPPSKV